MRNGKIARQRGQHNSPSLQDRVPCHQRRHGRERHVDRQRYDTQSATREHHHGARCTCQMCEIFGVPGKAEAACDQGSFVYGRGDNRSRVAFQRRPDRLIDRRYDRRSIRGIGDTGFVNSFDGNRFDCALLSAVRQENIRVADKPERMGACATAKCGERGDRDFGPDARRFTHGDQDRCVSRGPRLSGSRYRHCAAGRGDIGGRESKSGLRRAAARLRPLSESESRAE